MYLGGHSGWPLCNCGNVYFGVCTRQMDIFDQEGLLVTVTAKTKMFTVRAVRGRWGHTQARGVPERPEHVLVPSAIQLLQPTARRISRVHETPQYAGNGEE